MRAWLLAVLLVAAQAAGLAHRVNHPQQAGSFTTAAAQAQQGLKSQSAGSSSTSLSGDHRAGSADCRLIDQLMHADALCLGAAVVAVLPQAHGSASAPRAETVRAASPALYLARAPPAG
jgi:hypothetical protein